MSHSFPSAYGPQVRCCSVVERLLGNLLRNSFDRGTLCEGGNVFGARAYRKAADIIAGYGSKITSGKEMGKLQGIGKGTVARVSCSVLDSFHLIEMTTRQRARHVFFSHLGICSTFTPSIDFTLSVCRLRSSLQMAHLLI